MIFMKRKYFYSLFQFILLAFVFSGCDKAPDDETCLSFHTSPVTNVAGPVTAMANEEITLTVSFSCFNGCGHFNKFEEATAGNTSTITVQARYQGCVCTMDVPIRQVAFKFKKSQPGTYTLRFFQDHHNYLDHTIVVQ